MNLHRLRLPAPFIIAAASLLGARNAHAVDIEPLHVEISVHGQPFLGEGCEGGDWTLTWAGDVAGETHNLSDLLISYSSFDTTHEHASTPPPASVRVNNITCRDHQGAVVLQTSMSGGKREVRTVVALKNDPGIPSPFFDFSVDDAGVCRVRAQTVNQVLESNVIQIRAPLMATLSPDLAVTREELEKGFSKRFKIDGQALVSATLCMGTPIDHASVTLSYKRNDKTPTVSLAGCAHVPKGASAQVMARFDPPGGRLQFSAEPAATLNLRPAPDSVTITGATPGRATLKAEYTLNGKSATATLPASSIELRSINGGTPIPKLGLLDINGKPSSKVHTFPFEAIPGDAGDLLIFKLEQEAIASLITNRNSIGIQPVREGRTLLQAKTVCGAPVGEPVEIEIVTCDDEVRGELQRKQDELIRREKDIVRRITQMVADPEFQRAATEIRDSTITLATKTGELIAATLTAGEANAVKNGLGSAANLHQISTAQSIWDGYNVFNDVRAGSYGSAAFSMLVMAINDARASALKSAYESANAAQKFGMDLGLIAGVVKELEELEPQHDRIRRDLDQITRRLHQCDKLPPPPPLPPKKPDSKPPKPTEPTQLPPVDVPPDTEIPVPEQPQQPVDEAPPIIDPPDAPVSGGLCVRRVDEPVPASELRNILESANQFKTTAQRAREVFESFQETLNQMQAAKTLEPLARTQAIRSLEPSYDAFVQQFFKLGEASRTQAQRFALCTEELPRQIDTARNAAAAKE